MKNEEPMIKSVPWSSGANWFLPTPITNQRKTLSLIEVSHWVHSSPWKLEDQIPWDEGSAGWLMDLPTPPPALPSHDPRVDLKIGESTRRYQPSSTEFRWISVPALTSWLKYVALFFPFRVGKELRFANRYPHEISFHGQTLCPTRAIKPCYPIVFLTFSSWTRDSQISTLKRIGSVFLGSIENNRCRACELWKKTEVIPCLTISSTFPTIRVSSRKTIF